MGRGNFTSMQPTTLDLFAGAGGFSLGFHSAGFSPGVAIDNNPHAVETLEANFSFNGLKVLKRNLATFDPKNLKKELKEEGIPSSFDVIIGGPPCQGWSAVGRGKIRSLRGSLASNGFFKDPRNKLYRSFINFVEHLRPSVAVMENVPGMLSHNGNNVAEDVKVALSKAGYEVTWEKLNSCHYGVPQNRERLIFVGVRKDLGTKFIFPPWETVKGLRLYKEVTVRDAIGDLPIIRNGANDWTRPYNHSKKLKTYAKLMREGADSAVIFDHVCRNQNKQDLKAFRFLKQGGKYIELPKSLKRYRDDIFKDKYKKLFWNKPSWTVTAHLSKDCYTHIHPSQARTISVREAARIQSFPDRFYFAGSLGTKFQLIGNAVPPLMAKFIGEAVLKQVFKTGAEKARRAG